MVPDLEPSVPSYAGKVWLDSTILFDGGETYSANPVNVVVLLRGKLALTLCIEQLKVLFSSSRDNLSAVW
jgi:hypothetical protein